MYFHERKNSYHVSMYNIHLFTYVYARCMDTHYEHMFKLKPLLVYMLHNLLPTFSTCKTFHLVVRWTSFPSQLDVQLLRNTIFKRIHIHISKLDEKLWILSTITSISLLIPINIKIIEKNCINFKYLCNIFYIWY